MKRFEYDLAKSLRNKLKHGIDFEEAQLLWSGAYTETILEFHSEERIEIAGKIDGVFWTAITTLRSKNIRIISVRRSREKEKRSFEKRAKETDR